jgi:hypothetical protein
MGAKLPPGGRWRRSCASEFGTVRRLESKAMQFNRLALVLASAVAHARQKAPENASGFAGRRAKNA